jgi:Short C-terminal domain
LSTRLAQLDDALQAGLITQQDYDKKRADIIASA